MKKILSAITAAAFLVACNTTPNPTATTTTTTTTTVPDTSGFAQFQAWKAQSELAPQDPNLNNAVATAPAASATRSYAPVRRSSSSSSTRRSSSSSSGSSGSMSSSSSSTASAPAKKGWSKAAKGAVIGGVVGAGAGAVINKKNRAAGAVIGGILGAAGGFGIGRAGDKKDGRY